METPQTNTNTEGKQGFVPIPNLDKMRVGHAGLYESDDDVVDTAAEVIAADIPLGLKGGKTLIDCEKGIKAFVKDVLASNRNNHLPNSELGVWVHYLTEGIARDFNRTWEQPPISIREKATPAVKARKEGKRSLSKGEKNLLLDRLSYTYYEEDVNSGKITQQDAFSAMAEAAAKKKELEDAGFFINPNRTQGVCLFDWKSIVRAAHGDEKATRVYTKYKVEVIIPNIVENFYLADSKPMKLAREIGKSPLFDTEGVADEVLAGLNKHPFRGVDGKMVDATEFENLVTIKSDSDVYKHLKDNKKYASSIANIDKDWNIKGFHLTKICQSGMMKPRQICIDCVSKKDGAQRLFLFDRDGGVLGLQLDKMTALTFDERRTKANG